mgnify:CR=1 FL=1
MDLGIHRGTTIALVVAQFRTGVDLRALSIPSLSASSMVFENQVQGYDEVACRVASAVSMDDLIRLAT